MECHVKERQTITPITLRIGASTPWQLTDRLLVIPLVAKDVRESGDNETHLPLKYRPLCVGTREVMCRAEAPTHDMK